MRKLALIAQLLMLCHSLAFAAPALQDASYVISGNTHDGAGHNVPGVVVCAFPVEVDQKVVVRCGRSDAAGRFTIMSLKAGKYTLSSKKLPEGYMPQRHPFYKNPSMPEPEVTVGGSNLNSFVSINLGPKHGSLAGSNVDAATGLPVENARIILCQAASPQVCFFMSAKDAKGRFSLLAPHVPFTLRIEAEGYETWFGLSGSDRRNPITVASGATTQLTAYLKRRRETKDQAISEVEKQPGVNLAAPLQLSPADNVKLDYYPRVTKLEWSSVEGAASYTVEIDYCRGGAEYDNECIDPQPFKLRDSPPMTGLVETTYEFEFLGAQPGRWRVWAVDEKGVEGFKSPWRTFFYLH